MFERNEPQQQQHWSVHAEFTISHPGVSDPENLPQTSTEQGDNGVRMTYTWTTQAQNNNQNNNSWSTRSTPPPTSSTQPPPPPPHSGSSSNRSTFSDTPQQKPYGFQKGNLLFTSTPPPRRPFSLGVQDSGYGSDLLSPNSLGGGGYRRPIQPYNRKCRSTCNIVLSTNIQDENRNEDKTDNVHMQCGRTQSLRCQTPTLRCDRKEDYYGCGDPWCHHSHYGDDFSCTGRVSPVIETCEDCLSNNSGQTSSATSKTSRTVSTVKCCDHYRTSSSLPPEICEKRKDACVQTFEMIDKCTSPYLKIDNFNFGQKQDRNSNKKKYSSNARRRTEPIFQRSQSPSSITPDSLENQRMPLRRAIRSPKLNKLSPAVIKEKRESSVTTDSKSNDPSKKPRTVHIDVYCTGTEMESSSSGGSSSESTDNELVSTPQTVFESQKVKITHKRANQHHLPFNIQKTQNGIKNLKDKIEDNDESDDDGASTAYPSKLSSYSTIRDFSSSVSTVPHSWTNYSMSSCTVPDDNESVANTSWKDTFSDIESLLQSRSSLAQTESLDFVPRKLYEKNPSIDETPEIDEKHHLLETPSNISLQGSDSFEYADSVDRLRIRKMEELWRNQSPQQSSNNNKSWKSPHVERKHMLQQKKIQEYLQKRLNDKSLPNWKSKDSDSEGSDDLETGWSFVANQSKTTEEKSSKETHNNTKPDKLTIETGLKQSKSQDPDRGSLSDSSSSPTKSPSLKQRLSLDPNLRAPFTILPGIYTEQRAVAKKFGSIVNVFRKPGHHVGPAKNPDCLCDHCQRYFQTFQRNRTRSMGDPTPITNWKNSILNPPTQSKSNRSVPSQLYNNFQ